MLFHPGSNTSLEAWLALLDVLDQGIVVCNRSLARIRLANREALAALAAFGAGEGLPAAIPAALGELVEDRFSRATEIVARGGQRYFVRGRLLGDPLGGALILINVARMRRETLIDALHRRFGLTRRQAELVVLVRDGLSNEDAATSLGITGGTVRQYLTVIYEKVGVSSRTQLVAVVAELS